MTAIEAPFSALADPARRRIIQLLAAGPLPVHAIQQHFAFSQPALSKHLRVLRDAGLVAFEKKGRTHHYTLEGGAIQDAASWLLELYEFWNTSLDKLGDVLNTLEDEETQR